MKYYTSPNYLSHYSSTTENSVSSYTNLVEKLKDNYNLSDVVSFSQQIYALIKDVKNKLFYTYTNEILDKLYISRFVLPQQQFCEIQEFLFSNPQGKGGHPIVPHIDTFFENIDKNHLQPFSEVDKNILELYYMGAKLSEKSEFSLNTINLLDLNIPQSSYSYSRDTTYFYDFINFAKHTIAFNYFKDFLLFPNKVNPEFLFKTFSYINLKNNSNPRLNELWSFAKLMEQEHYDILAQAKNNSIGLCFIEKSLFFSNPRPNSKGPFYNPTYDENVVHTINYDVFDTLNQKSINLNIFFNKSTQHNQFSSFVLDSIEQQLKNTLYTYDKEGYEHLLSLLKIQDYFYLNDKLSAKNFKEKTTKI